MSSSSSKDAVNCTASELDGKVKSTTYRLLCCSAMVLIRLHVYIPADEDAVDGLYVALKELLVDR
jgi:hypothetical protein